MTHTVFDFVLRRPKHRALIARLRKRLLDIKHIRRNILGEATSERPVPEPRLFQRWAAQVRTSGYFDLQHYCESTGIAFASDVEASLHYVNGGEYQGFCPSTRFDPMVYRLTYPDLSILSSPLILHFLEYGLREGRDATFDLQGSMYEGQKEYQEDRQTLLLCVHEASMTGAPILAANIARHMADAFNLIVLSLRTGVLREEFQRNACLVICPKKNSNLMLSSEILKRLVLQKIRNKYGLDFVLANSAETDAVIVAAEALGIPNVMLVHEFSEYVLPRERMKDILNYSTGIVFSSRLTESSARAAIPIGEFRHSFVFPQGKSLIPTALPAASAAQLNEIVSACKASNKFLVIGCGYVQMRKGLDLFISTAARVARDIGRNNVHFLWVGDGFNPEEDYQVSLWLKDQICRSELQETVTILPAVAADDLEVLYRTADAMFISSRLDPFPNVSIDAICAGLPVVCFDRATGVAEYISGIDGLEGLVAPYLDVEAAAAALARIASDPAFKEDIRHKFSALASRHFNMERYVDRVRGTLDLAGLISAQERKDVQSLEEANALSDDMIGDSLGEGISSAEKIRRYVRVTAAKTFGIGDHFRRPLPGFSPHIYEGHHPELSKPPFPNALAHWIDAGRPTGPWTHDVLRLTSEGRQSRSATELRVALHIHLHYPELIEDILARLDVNRTRPDLFVSVTSNEGREVVANKLRSFRGEKTIRTVPNRGRDLGPMLTAFRSELQGYDIFGHVHGKKSLALGSGGMGDVWRDFLLGTLIGAKFSALDDIISKFFNNDVLGLIFPEDPHVVDWSNNIGAARDICSKIHIPKNLPRNIEFPVGNMFFARPDALAPLFNAGFTWDDYPEEPLTYDGTMLHAVERLTPIICENAGYRWMTVYAPGVTR